MNKLFHIPVLDKWLVYAPFSQQVALTNRSAVDVLISDEDQVLSSQLTDFKQRLLTDIKTVPELPQDKICPSFLGIIPTRGCNIGCVYCDFSGPTSLKTHMDPRIAVATVDWMAKRLADLDQRQFQIHFFGGEPFIAPEIIDVVVHRARLMAKKYGLELYFDASTNGMYNDTMCQFIGDYFGGVVLSLDGPAQFHNKNRPASNGRPTFDRVDRTARILKDMPVDLCIRVCITQDSVTQMEEIAQWICETYSPTAISLESLTPGEVATKAGLQTPDPYLFAKHCLAAYNIASELGIKAVYSAAEISNPRTSFCPVGTDALIVSHDGQINACYLLPEDWKKRHLNLTVGQVDAHGNVAIDFDAIQFARKLPKIKPRCEGCFCQWSCAGGCHVNHTYIGSSISYSEFCIQTRLLTAALLLSDLGEDSYSKKLMNDSVAMKALVLQSSDAFNCNGSETKSSSAIMSHQLQGSLVGNGMNISG